MIPVFNYNFHLLVLFIVIISVKALIFEIYMHNIQNTNMYTVSQPIEESEGHSALRKENQINVPRTK